MPRLTFDALEVLDAIDRRGSFAAAARALHRVPSALTYTVQKAEQDLDVLLFDRRGHRAVLTAAGRELLEQGRHLLAAADEMEARVRRLGNGWETELRIAVNDVVGAARLVPLLGQFCGAHGGPDGGTRLRLRHEVLGGTWDALAARRADLAIGVTGDAPPGGGFRVRPLGHVPFVFAVARDHPLAAAPEPLPRELVRRHRAAAVGDTSASLPVRSAGILSGQDVLTVPDLATKVAVQVAGLACGFLPLAAARPEVERGALVVKRVEEDAPLGDFAYAWRTGDRGKALRWFLDRLESEDVRASLLPR
jgi:DNA-binding transcriptional LysR family regulator